jgi:outer membrane protein OmpA-like peptidoglycan-associated protein
MTMIREIIGLVSIALGLLLLVVSFYLSLRRIHARAEGPSLRDILVVLAYGFLFFFVGIIIDHTAPPSREARIAETPGVEEIVARTDELVEVGEGEAAEAKEKKPKVEGQSRLLQPEAVRVRTQPPRRTEPPIPVTVREPPLEDRIYTAIDDVLRKVEEFFERYGFPVEVETSSRPVLAIAPIFFEDTTADIPPKYFPLLDEAAQVIRDHGEVETIEVQGHTDGEGPEVYNFLITQSRANAARDYLIAQGIEPERLVAKGYGTTRPLPAREGSTGTARDRRIQFVAVRATE